MASLFFCLRTPHVRFLTFLQSNRYISLCTWNCLPRYAGCFNKCHRWVLGFRSTLLQSCFTKHLQASLWRSVLSDWLRQVLRHSVFEIDLTSSVQLWFSVAFLLWVLYFQCYALFVQWRLCSSGLWIFSLVGSFIVKKMSPPTSGLKIGAKLSFLQNAGSHSQDYSVTTQITGTDNFAVRYHILTVRTYCINEWIVRMLRTGFSPRV